MKSTLLPMREKAILVTSVNGIAPRNSEFHTTAEAETPLPSINFDLEQIEHPHGDTRPTRPPATDSVSSKDTAAAIESLPHLASRVVSLWKTRDLNTFIFDLLMDSRDGDRKGFHPEVAKELMFLAKLNLLLRAQEAAPLLGVTVDEASDLIAKGDHAAMGHTLPAHDVWGINPGNHDKSNPLRKPAAKLSTRLAQGHPNPVAETLKNHLHAKPAQVHARLSWLLNEAPPPPPSVRIDLTTPKALRCSRDSHEHGDMMDEGFFRCIAKELGGLKIEQLVLSDLGNSEKCHWLPSAVRFAKANCRFAKVVLHVDLLTAPEQQLIACINAGLNHLVINLNLASGKWRAKAESIADSDPEYFRREIQRLVVNRDRHTAQTGHHCAISVIQPHGKSSHYLREEFRHLTSEPGITHYQEVTPPNAVTETHAEFHGACHCWAPFIEAHVRTNGHLVACAQDHSGYSFTADLKHTSFLEAWHSHSFQKIRQRVLHGEKPGRLCDVCPHKALKN